MDTPPRYQSIRAIALVIVAACIAAAIFAPMPGTRVYRDSSDCFGRALGGMFAMHHGDHHETSCEKNFVAAETKPAGGDSLWVLLVALIGGGALVAWFARPKGALIWSAGTYVLSIIQLVATFELELDIFDTERTQTLWAGQALGLMMLTSYVALIVLFVIAIRRMRAERRAQEPAPVTLPKAVVV